MEPTFVAGWRVPALAQEQTLRANRAIEDLHNEGVESLAASAASRTSPGGWAGLAPLKRSTRARRGINPLAP